MAAGALFSKTVFNCSSGMFALCLFAKIVFCSLQNTKGKLTLRKIENIQLWHFVSSVAQNRNAPNFFATSRQTFQIHALKIQYGQATGHGMFCKVWSHKKMMRNVFLCVYFWKQEYIRYIGKVVRTDNRLILLYEGLKGKASVPTDDLIPKPRRCRNQHSDLIC